jgi:hypothetical protein
MNGDAGTDCMAEGIDPADMGFSSSMIGFVNMLVSRFSDTGRGRVNCEGTEVTDLGRCWGPSLGPQASPRATHRKHALSGVSNSH